MAGHRRFWKNPGLDYKPGNPFPKTLRLHAGDTEETDLACIRSSPVGSFAFFMNASCDACSLEPIIEFSKSYPEFDYFLFQESDLDDLTEARRQLPHFKGVFSCEIITVNETLDYGAVVPWVFTVNNRGQIISGYPVRDAFMLEMIAEPFARTFFPGREKTFQIR